MPENQNPVKYFARWLRYLDFTAPLLEGGFLIIPVSSPNNATEIRSSLIEGGLLLYPEAYQEVYVPAMLSEFNTCEMIAQCLLANEEFMQAIQNSVGENERQRAIEQDQNSSDDWSGNEIVSNSLDAVWGGCLELSQYIFEVMNSLLNYADGFADAIDTVASLESVTKYLPVNVTPTNPALPSPQTLSLPNNAIVPVDGIPTIKVNRDVIVDTKKVTQPNKIAFFLAVFEVGIAILKGAFNSESNMEAIAGELFNILTCLENVRVEDGTPIVFSTLELNRWANELASSGEPYQQICAILVKIEELGGGEFLSFLGFGDAFRQYNLGLRAPSSTWEIIVEECSEVEVWEATLDFRTSQHGFSIVDEWGGWIDGVGFGAITKTGATGSPIRIQIVRQFDPFVYVVDVTTSGVRSAGRVFSFTQQLLQVPIGSAGDNFNNIPESWEYTTEANFVASSIYAESVGTAFGGTTTLIQEMTIRGIGFNPFE